MGVIDKDTESFRARHGLETSRHLRGILERFDRFAHIVAESLHRGQGGEGVVDVERAEERETHEVAFAARMERILRAVQIGAQVGRSEHGVRRLAVGDGVDALGDTVEKPAPVTVIDVDHRSSALVRLPGQLVEQALLGREIGLHRLVVIEVVLRQVGEDRGIKLDVADAVLVQRVARCLHDRRAAIDIAHLAQQTLHIIRLGRGPRRGNFARSYHIAHGADEPARALGHVEQVLEQEGDSGFSVRSRHPGGLELQRRMAVKSCSRPGKSEPWIGHAHHGGTRHLQVSGRDDSGRTFLHRLENMVCPASRGVAGPPRSDAG